MQDDNKKSLITHQGAILAVITQPPKRGLVARGLDEMIGLVKPSFEAKEDLYKKAFDFLNGENGLAKDDQQALHYFKLSANSGYSDAMVMMGNFYEIGMVGLTQDYNHALYWYQKGMDDGNDCAITLLASKYENGHGVAQDFEKSLELLKKSALGGNEYSMHKIGEMFCYAKKGVEKDYEQAFYWFGKAAEQNYAEAQNRLGSMFHNGIGVKQDDEQALIWYRRAAEQGDERAQCNLALMLSMGKGVDKNYTEAVSWFHKAAEQGDAQAQTRLAFCYRIGEGLMQDDEQAVIWYRRAAEQNYAGAQYSLGLMYEYGRGVLQNKQLAIMWYGKAAEQGYVTAQNVLARIKTKNLEQTHHELF